MGGTIRCKHGHVLVNLGIVGQRGYENQSVFLGHDPETLSHEDSFRCETSIQRKLWDNIQTGANFTHVFFETKGELDKYLDDNARGLRFVGSASSEMPDGRYYLVY